ncbi:MAG: MoaD/ThiS family protein [Peptococcaceae bacterium]|nr:MoaD/ThiS family protein [Peptococcaceae bacterium]
MTGKADKRVEVRGFSFIKDLLDRRQLPFPFYVDLPEECTAGELAKRLEIPADMIEAVFINGIVRRLNDIVRPGDRVAFVPPGTPGPYRVILGIKDFEKSSTQ